MKKLIDLERDTRIGVEHLGFVYEESGDKVKELNFINIDGMYSLCTDDLGNYIHLRFDTEVVDLGKINLIE